MTKKKSVTQRAAEAVKNNAPSSELTAIKAEISQRISEVAKEKNANLAKIERVMSDGDLDALRELRQSEACLKDEDTMLYKQQSELHRALGIALGEEAVKAEKQHAKDLAAALKQAEQAQQMLKDARRAAQKIYLARQHAETIGEKLVFDANTIRALAAAIHPEGNLRKQLMIDLGMRDASRIAA